MPHLLVTNDFPPKVGGIQNYLWELWRRLPPEDVTVLTTAYEGAAAFDRSQPYRVERIDQKVMVPTPGLVRRIDELADEVSAKVVLLDPVLWPPLGLIGSSLRRPYALVLHGAEVTVPARLPGARRALASALRGACHVISAGEYAADEARMAAGSGMPPTTVVPPGVDPDRFRPLGEDDKHAARRRFGLSDDPDAFVVVGVSRLVPRKGFDVVIDAAVELAPRYPKLQVAIAGGGRDHDRLEKRIAASHAPARLLGRVPDDDLPALYGCADAFAMVCRNRWAGLEQEGFGIVFLEAAACGVPQIAGDSGGSAEAVVDGDTGVVIRRPSDAREVAAAIERLMVDRAAARAMGARARARAEASFSYDVLADRLGATLAALP
ncbi:MAG TPA: glycosyltransferase family 4 protein [Acidimicrobiales bacterium]|nr:glycosyltransferase family 4 protein [Acidimicrobiales bacterium]